jgi:2-hydroxy-3-keto-5-methylthiopentenyl-1-phosphate phosphatase
MTVLTRDQGTSDGYPIKTVVQCDFDGTVTLEDASFIMLDAYACGDWRAIYEEYVSGRKTVGRFNEEAFSMVKASKEALLAVIEGKITIRRGFDKLVACCQRKGFRFVIVSNGLDFYIEHLMTEKGFADIEIHASRTHYQDERLSVRYIGPDGTTLDTGFKEAYVEEFLQANYRVIYIGDGTSDFLPARKCHHVFATQGALLKRCEEEKIACTPFSGFEEVALVLEGM